jgi:hypothetical protein
MVTQLRIFSRKAGTKNGVVNQFAGSDAARGLE